MNYQIGDRRKLSCQLRDEDNVLADPDALTFTMTAPDDTVTTYTYGTDAQLIRDDTGQFHVFWDCTQEGLHRYKWVASGTLALVQGSSFLVGDDQDLSTVDVENYTQGRLLRDDQEVQKMLNAALVAARRHCGWHVTPVMANYSMTLDGPDSRILVLPTRKIIELNSIAENDVDLNLNTLRWSAGGPPGIMESPVRVRKRSGAFWSGEYQAIVAVVTHGYTAEEAADWRYAILAMVDQMALASTSGRGELDVVSKKVDDVTYRWADPYASAAETALYSVTNILCGYELPRLEFL